MQRTLSGYIPLADFRSGSGFPSDFEVVPIRDLRKRRGGTSHRLDRPHRLGFFSVIFVSSGEGDHFVDFQALRYRPGSAIFCARGQVHAFGEIDGLEGFQILFTENFLLRHGINPDRFSFFSLRERGIVPSIVHSEGGVRETLASLIRDMRRECSLQEDFARGEILASLLRVFLLRCERLSENSLDRRPNLPHADLFARFRESLSSRCFETRDVGDYARELGVSPKHLNAVCKEVSGMQAKRCVDDWVMLEIKRLLAATDLSVKEISAATGFDEPTNFVKFFRSRGGMTPARFRESLLSGGG